MLNFLKMCLYCTNPHQTVQENESSNELSFEKLSRKGSKRHYTEKAQSVRKPLEKLSETPAVKQTEDIIDQSTNGLERPTDRLGAILTSDKDRNDLYNPLMKQISFRMTSPYTELKPIVPQTRKQSLPTADMKYKLIRKELRENAF